MKREKLPGYWPTRILLAIGILVTAADVATLVLMPRFVGGPMFDPALLFDPTPFAISLALFGLAWMIRIFRGPRDEPPPWRSRTR